MLRDHEAAHVLRKMAREADELVDEHDELARHAHLRIESQLHELLWQLRCTVEPLQGLRQCIHHLERQAECFADIAHRHAAAVADDGRSERRAVAAVFVVDVLNDLLTALMLEVNVDVRRLGALLGDEAFEEHADPRRVDRGDAQAIADGGIRGAAAALAENVLGAREAHHVLDGKEIVLVAQHGNECELFVDLLSNLRGRARGPATRGALQGQFAQVLKGGHSFGHELFGIFVVQSIEREGTRACDVERRREELARVELAQRRKRPQVPLAVGECRTTDLIDRGSKAYRRQDIMQRPPFAQVIVHVPYCNEWQTVLGTEFA